MQNLSVVFLDTKNCCVSEFANLLSLIEATKADEALERLKMSERVYNLFWSESTINSNFDFLGSQRFLLYLGIFRSQVLIAIGAIKFYPAGVKIWAKEEKRNLVPISCMEYGLVSSVLLKGIDGLHLITLPAYLEIGSTAVLPVERGKGLHILLHKKRLEILQTWQVNCDNVPKNFLITSTGTLTQRLKSFNSGIDFSTITFLSREFIPDDIWHNLGQVRSESQASAHLAMKMNFKAIGFAKSTGGLVFWSKELPVLK